jgi:hypothetical protein
VSAQRDLGKIDRDARAGRRLAPARLLLPVGWLLAAVGYYGPWIAHKTAALTLSGADMGEFVKFLPGVLDGSLRVTRQLFYLPALAVVVSVAMLVGLRRLRYGWPLQALALMLALPVSLQILPPAWSPASLMTPEFRLQAIALGVSWVLLAGFWLWARAPAWLGSFLGAALALAAALGCAWQMVEVKPAIDAVHGMPSPLGWGFFLCLAGLVVLCTGGVVLAWRSRSGEPWWSG